MKEIAVPAVPNTAFNKHRPMSDLIKKQVEHFKHLEHKLPPDVRAQLPQHGIVTEDDAARYIGPMTRYFLSQKATATAASKVTTLPRPAEGTGLALAAAAEDASGNSKQKSGTGKKTAAKSAKKRKK